MIHKSVTQPLFKQTAIHICLSAFTVALISSAYPLVAQPQQQPEADNDRPAIEARIYGTIQADFRSATAATAGNNGVESLRRTNHAKRPIQHDDDHSRNLFSANSSRLGFAIAAGSSRGVIELDFDGSATTQVGNVSEDLIRLRQAFVSHDFQSGTTIFAGQRHGLFSPLSPKTFQLGSNLFGTGNVGFIQEQIGFEQRLGNHSGIMIAVGSPGKSGDYGPNRENIYGSPAVSIQLYTRPTESLKLYLSGIQARLVYHDAYIDNALRNLAVECPASVDPNNPMALMTEYNLYPWNIERPPYDTCTGSLGYDRETADPLGTPGSLYAYPWAMMPQKVSRGAGGLSFGAEFQPSPLLRIAFEIYQGTNLGDLNQQGIGRLTDRRLAERLAEQYIDMSMFTGVSIDQFSAIGFFLNERQYTSIKEEGGWISATLSPSERIDFTLLGGFSRVKNQEDLNQARGDLTMDNSGLREDGGGFNRMGDIAESRLYGWNLGFKFSPNFTFFLEHHYLRTSYHEAERSRGIMHNISYSRAQNRIVVNLRNPLVAKALTESGMLVNSGTGAPYNLYLDNERAAPTAEAHLYSAGMQLRF